MLHRGRNSLCSDIKDLSTKRVHIIVIFSRVFLHKRTILDSYVSPKYLDIRRYLYCYYFPVVERRFIRVLTYWRLLEGDRRLSLCTHLGWFHLKHDFTFQCPPQVKPETMDMRLTDTRSISSLRSHLFLQTNVVTFHWLGLQFN